MLKCYCHRCQQVTEHITMVEAARRLRKNRKTIRAWMEAGGLAHIVLPSGRRLLCTFCLLFPQGPKSRLDRRPGRGG